MSFAEATYRSLLGKLMQLDSRPLVQAYAAIEGFMKEVDTYVKVCVCVCVCVRACVCVCVRALLTVLLMTSSRVEGSPCSQKLACPCTIV